METKTVNTELWKVMHSELIGMTYIKEGRNTIVHMISNNDYADDEDAKKQKENAELIVTAVNACRTINPDNPLNAALAYANVAKALQHCLSVFTQLADAGKYPFPLMAENGGEGFGFITNALKQATE